MSEFDCVAPDESDSIASAIQNGSGENSVAEAVTAILADDKQSKDSRMEEIDFEKELMAIRASEDDDEIEGVVSNSRSTPNNHSNSRSSDRNVESFLNSNDSGAANVVMGRSDSIDDDELRQLLQESDTEGEQQLLGRQKSSSSSNPHSKKDHSFNDSSVPDVTMPPDGIIENDDGTYSCYVIVPAGKAGMVIGTAGSTVKQMMSESKTKMNLVQDSSSNTGADKPLRIVGERENVLKAKEMVLHLINQGGAPSFVDLHVPKFAVGMIIGNRGATINKLQDEYGVRIQIKPDQNPEGNYRVCQILGEPNKYQNAAQKVLDLVAAVEAKDKARTGTSGSNKVLAGDGTFSSGMRSNRGGGGGDRNNSSGGGGGGGGGASNNNNNNSSGSKNYKHEVHMTVHEKAIGRIIGKGGANIKRMMQESGAKIEMDKNNVNSKNGRVVFILSSSSMNSIEEAQDLINEAAKKPETGGGGGDRGGSNNNNNRDVETNYYGGISSTRGNNRTGVGNRDSSGGRSFNRGFDNRGGGDDIRSNRYGGGGNNQQNDNSGRNSSRKRYSDFRSRSPEFDDTSRTKVIKTEIISMNHQNNQHNNQGSQHQPMPTPMMPMGMMPMGAPNMSMGGGAPTGFMPPTPMMPPMMAPPPMTMPAAPKPNPVMPHGFPPMMAPPGVPGMPPFPMPGMPPGMPPMMQPPTMPPNPMAAPAMPPVMTPQPAAAPSASSMPSWPGFPPVSHAATPVSTASAGAAAPSMNPFEMWMQYAKMAAAATGNQSSSSPVSKPAPPAATTSHSSSSRNSSSSGGGGAQGGGSSDNDQDAWMKCYKIFMDTMQDKDSSSSSSHSMNKKQQHEVMEVKKEPVVAAPAPPPVQETKKDYTKEWQEYMAKLYAAGGASSQMEAWKKWTEKYQEYLKSQSSR